MTSFPPPAVPTPDAVAATARTAGLDLPPAAAARIAAAVAPAFAAFAPVSGTLPFDLEPATFLTVQMRELAK
ncbi:hypothetical protein [Aquabacter spiritensis]|uniref:Uncharacterized protein n=1 Tax=Aquabacter spiritensis TaxID=933073 RepID=A0A4R3LMR1_9HYPH|nr:hypothetical protein [Aquabacter spiritensis]TCT01673.1 hypothetical protein EDC64_11724 [Aquabacter spiritensis]